MLSKYGILCEVIAEGSFTKVAEHFGYAQSSISASVKSVEEELSTSLIDRRRHNITWTEDGRKEEVVCGDTERALDYEIADMERAVSGDPSVMRLDYTTDVMNLMTAIRKKWGYFYDGEKL